MQRIAKYEFLTFVLLAGLGALVMLTGIGMSIVCFMGVLVFGPTTLSGMTDEWLKLAWPMFGGVVIGSLGFVIAFWADVMLKREHGFNIMERLDQFAGAGKTTIES